ncbi:hypothetical protein NFA_19520 [Nocardia farcinica IFM 10152]|uniref:Uncharacterized protein n=1 Tax=Nocardia farcinica (strain IFM 10152) TaxID=247156 RepID=Q5YYE3_NOCFA|nr:hypothetical protein NFA_19520 [Nocardia farcinica IFM 10152]
MLLFPEDDVMAPTDRPCPRVACVGGAARRVPAALVRRRAVDLMRVPHGICR